MNAKLKGLFKGLRYISSIFEEEKEEEEIVIGLPTDVKHVSHVGWEGPTPGAAATPVEAAPSWMNKFSASEGVTQSVPQNVGGVTQSVSKSIGGTKENYETLRNSEETKRSKSTGSSRDSKEHAQNNTTRRLPKELHENTQNTNSPKREKARNSRRRSSKEPSENGSSSNKHLQTNDATLGLESSPSRNTTEAPKGLRRKKSKENRLDGDTGGHVSSRSSRSKGRTNGVDHQSSLNSVASNDSPLRTFG